MKIVSPFFTAVLAAVVFAPRADATAATECKTVCPAGSSPACQSLPVTAGASAPIPTTGAPTCATTGQKKYISALKLHEATGRAITVAFKQGASGAVVTKAATNTDIDNGDSASVCYYDYANVGKTDALTDDVIATVTCPAGTNCDVKYTVTYACPPSACATVSPAGSTSAAIAAGATQKATIPIPTDAPTCPYGQKRYISSLKVSEDAGLGIAVAFKQGASGAVVTKAETTKNQDNASPKGTADCYFSYDDVGKADTLTDDVIATVTCANNAAACNIKYVATYACSPTVATCPSAVTGLTSRALTAADTNGFDVKRGATCAAGQIDYLKSLDVRGEVDVTFNNGLTPTAVSKGASCFYYKDVKAVKTTDSDVVATVTCKSGSACPMSYAAEWGCTDPILYTRQSVSGANCVADLSDCANRCAKSLQLVKSSTTSGSTTTTKLTFKAQFTRGCTCTDLETTVSSAAGADPVTASATSITVTATESDNTLTIANTATDKVCTTTYKRVAFENKFADKSYTRTTVTPSSATSPATTAADCTPADLTVAAACPYKCAAEFGLSKPVPDAIRATQTAVDGCTCAPIEVVVGDAGDTAGNGSATLKYDFTKSTNDVTVATTTITPAVAASGSTPAVAAKTTICTALYKENCPKLCTDPACATKAIDAVGWQLKNLDGCPAYRFSYPKSLIVRAQLAEGAVSVKVGSGNAETPLTDAEFTGTCYKTYGAIGGAEASIAADVEPTVTCTGGACTVTVKPEWACTPAKCPTDLTAFSEKQSLTVPSAAGVAVAAPTGKCTTGKAYLKSLDIRTTASKDVVVTFNNDLKPEPTSKGDTCTFYSNVIGLTDTATDVTATINCKSTTAGDTCTVQYKADWGCYTPAAPVKYTRTGAPAGRGCVNDLISCANRCAKSYQLITAGGDKMLVPQFTAGCACPSLTATTDGTTATKAKNTVTTMEVNEVAASNTLTVEYTAPGKECKTTFAKTAFENKFAAKTYTRGTVPTECVVAETAAAADLCAYKCAAELTIKPTSDTINATETAVTGLTDCTCKELAGAVVDGDGNVAAGLFGSVKYSFALTSAGLDVTTVVGTKTCKVPYTVKATPAPTTAAPTSGPTSAPTPQPTTTTKTGTSAGVSALGAGADAGMVTVTLMAAAAGVQAVGLPA